MSPQGQSISPEVAELLTQLKPVNSPDPIGIWPPAPGWWVASILAIMLLIAITVTIHRFIVKRKQKKAVLTALEQASIANNTEMLCQQLNQLLKRFARKHFGDDVNSLSGKAWVDYLHNKPKVSSSNIDLSALGDAAYQPAPSIDKSLLIQQTREWILVCL